MTKIAIILLVVLCSSCCTHVITPVEMTYTAIGETFFRIHLYVKQNSVLPTSLDVLPKREGYSNRITDGWNRVLQYHIANDGVITLTSFGKDGKPGGTGDNTDISRSYYSKRKDGSLWVGTDMWIVEAEINK